MHDIQELDSRTDDEDENDENDEDSNSINLTVPTTPYLTVHRENTNYTCRLTRSRNYRRRLLHRSRMGGPSNSSSNSSSSTTNSQNSSRQNATSNNENSSSRNPPQNPSSRNPPVNNPARESFPPDIWVAEVTLHNRVNGLNAPASVASHVYGINSGLISNPINSPEQESEIIKTTKTVCHNPNRMLYYIQEPNKGKGFIKELCFSSDGRIVCSPYNYGIRLLAFNNKCSELPYTLNAESKPQEMYVIKTIKSHSDIVVSTKFSPKQPLIVSGCLRGKVVWHYPAL